MPTEFSEKNSFPTCEISHCWLLAMSKKGGLCSPHYQQKYRGKDPESYSTAHLSVKRCSHTGCEAPAVSKGLCASHSAASVKQRRTATCSQDGCDSPVSARGLCHKHYSRVAPSSSYRAVAERRKLGCDFPECTGTPVAKGLCRWHYEQRRSGVDPLSPIPLGGVRTCGFEGCGRPSGKRELCTAHANQLKMGKPLESLEKKPRTKNQETCRFPECESPGAPFGLLCSRHRSRARSHGLSDERMVELFADPKCESCGYREGLVIDHDHSCCNGKRQSCGKCVRGLLCTGCNVALGFLSESVSRIESLAKYARKHAGLLAD